MKSIAVVTSSRADYGIYSPLLKKLSDHFQVFVIASGTHLLRSFGNTIDEIERDGFTVTYKIPSLMAGDSPEEISSSIGLTSIKFSSLWASKEFDLVICLGDRYEMFAAIVATVPFNLSVAHIAGGETTLGAIDNFFRHSISLASEFHFVVAHEYKEKLEQLLGTSEKIYNVGSLSYDNLSNVSLLTRAEFFERFKINLDRPSILITIHPETVSFEENKRNIKEFIHALEKLDQYQLIITMPNADTLGAYIREELMRFISKASNAYGVESFGMVGYLTCMKYCSFMMGNTSSGFVEASYFPTKVINLGSRQTGRIRTANVIDCEFKYSEIMGAVETIVNLEITANTRIYGDGRAADKILEILKNEL